MILSNCTKTRTFSRYVYGDCILSLWRKSHFQRLEHKCFFAIITMIFGLFLKNGHASQTFFRRPLKKIFSGQHKKSGSTICSSYAAHPMASAFRADTDICFPDHFYQYCHYFSPHLKRWYASCIKSTNSGLIVSTTSFPTTFRNAITPTLDSQHFIVHIFSIGTCKIIIHLFRTSFHFLQQKQA